MNDWQQLLAGGPAIAPYQLPPAQAEWLFEAGLPDPATFPVDDLVRISADVLRDHPADALQYGAAHDGETSSGYTGLRDALAERTTRREAIALTRHNVMLTSGAASALALLFEAFVDAGDAVAVEVPTWNTNIATLARRGADLIALPIVDDDGFSVEHLEAELQRLAAEGRALKLVYTIATFNTPTGVCLSVARRRRLIELAKQWNFVIVEDNVYRELRYAGEHLPSLLALDEHSAHERGVAVRVDSFSKVLAPGVRLGWITGSPELIGVLGSIRGDLGVSQWIARVVEQYVREGLLEHHIDAVVALYRDKLAAAERALRDAAGPWVRWRTPDGGFFLWVELDASLDAEQVMAFTLEEGVLCRAGERFFGDGSDGRQFFRLAYPAVPIAEIERGMAVLGRAIERTLAGRPG